MVYIVVFKQRRAGSTHLNELHSDERKMDEDN